MDAVRGWQWPPCGGLMLQTAPSSAELLEARVLMSQGIGPLGMGGRVCVRR